MKVLACTLILVANAASFAENTNTDQDAIERLISDYATMINGADTTSAERIFDPNVTFIHPRGEERGRAQLIANFVQGLMGATFSERILTPSSVSAHANGDSAWAEFSWDFSAKVRKDGSPFHSKGRETQVFRRESGQWRIVHVHYSGEPVNGNLRGF
jgi:ketosteroid isomerase-like protein